MTKQNKRINIVDEKVSAVFLIALVTFLGLGFFTMFQINVNNQLQSQIDNLPHKVCHNETINNIIHVCGILENCTKGNLEYYCIINSEEIYTLMVCNMKLDEIYWKGCVYNKDMSKKGFDCISQTQKEVCEIK